MGPFRISCSLALSWVQIPAPALIFPKAQLIQRFIGRKQKLIMKVLCCAALVAVVLTCGCIQYADTDGTALANGTGAPAEGNGPDASVPDLPDVPGEEGPGSTAPDVPDVPAEPADEDPPVIYGIGISLEPWDDKTNYAGDVSFDGLQYEDKVFIEFGGYHGGEPNVHPTFVIPLGTQIHAVSDGIVYWRKTLGDNDYDICVYRHEGDEWCITYEHVMNPQVGEGDAVKTGDVIGEAGRINEFTESGKFDLKVWKGERYTVIDHCPYLLFDDSVKDEMQAKIARFASDWEEFTGKDVYDEQEWVSPGCAAETLEES
jgi:hypothetical protein